MVTRQSDDASPSVLTFTRRTMVICAGLLGLLLALAFLSGAPRALAQDAGPWQVSDAGQFTWLSPQAPTAPCPGGPTIDGITLDECFVENFNVAGDNVSVTVWYTKNVVTATRGSLVVEHWLTSDAQAQQVAGWGREAWERFHQVYGRHPYNCGLNVNIRMEDGVGWDGIARWNSSDCNIGIDAPMVRNGDIDAPQVVYHEFQHFMQRAYNAGCFGEVGPAYPNNSEWIEGYADLASDAVTAAVDAWMYWDVVNSYNPETSFYDKSYYDAFNKYLMEQLGSQWAPADPHHHLDLVREHYELCDVHDTLYVENTLVSDLSGGSLSWERLFLNFFAANWTKDWANVTTQPELVYTDDDANPYGSISLAQNVTLGSGSQNWTGETTPDDWAGRYYQVRPQAGCDYVTVAVDGTAGARLGINLMAADTAAPTSVSRSGWIGRGLTRTFAGHGVHDRVAAAVNSFAATGSYDVSFTCVTPVLDLLEPRPRPNSTLVGDPASPIAFLARWKVTSGGAPVRGIPEASFTGTAEGDGMTIVPGSFQEVGDEYWATMIPPTKSAGTTFVDMTLCLDSSLCDTNSDALLYVDPGHTDFALVFDASGSMDIEDVAGEGRRYENAQKAGTVLVDLLRDGDRIMVTEFSALDSPGGCGLPWGDGNCTLNLMTHLARTDVSVPATIATAETAIGNYAARLNTWTPVGAALQDAKNKLQAAPYSLNPKVIVLLSDGEENVRPLYEDIRNDLIASGVVVDTVGFGTAGEVGEATLAQIAADTGGTFRFVPAAPGTTMMSLAAKLDALEAMDAPMEMMDLLAIDWLPGPLALDDVYDYFETKNQGAARLFHTAHLDIESDTWRTASQYVDSTVNRLRFVVAGKEPDYGYGCATTYRNVEVLPPGSRLWVPVSPPTTLPAGWDVRNSLYDDVVIISNPAPGTWQLRAQYGWTGPCLQSEAVAEPAAPAQFEWDFIMNGSVQSDYHLEARFLAPIDDNQGLSGDPVPIVATILSRAGTLPNALVLAEIQNPGSTDYLWLLDDGLHMDGAAGDGIYGATYYGTADGGAYNVRILALFEDPLDPGNSMTREWLGSFWIQGLEGRDNDNDLMPDDWELRCDLNTGANDAAGDADRDGLSNLEEYQRGTVPCDADTDDGGERDGSEVAAGRNPFAPDDDRVGPMGHISVVGLNRSITVSWPYTGTCTNVQVYVSTNPNVLGTALNAGATGSYTITGLTNGTTYYLTFVCYDGTAAGDYIGPIEVTPRSDPYPPVGTVLINNGMPQTFSKHVTLHLSATDEPLEGPTTPGGGSMWTTMSGETLDISEVTQMRIGNTALFIGQPWEPYVPTKPWTLTFCSDNTCVVFAQFRDGAGNESLVAFDTILLAGTKVYLPTVLRMP